jgi:hypothetical protein
VPDKSQGGIVSTTTAILIVSLIIAVAVAVWAMIERRRALRIRQKFGPEYDRLANQLSPHSAATVLEKREKRVSSFHIRSLREDERGRFAAQWRSIQKRFVDDPRSAVAGADELIQEALRSRGYPMSEFEQRSADLSVEYPHVVENYRTAHRIASDAEGGRATTEELRQAMQHYRALFEDVLESKTSMPEVLEVHRG